jgi:hypothetical protein
MEVELEDLHGDHDTSSVKLAEDLHHTLGNRASIVLTDVDKSSKTSEVHRILNSIVKPMYCGINRNTENKIYMWIITKTALNKFIKNEKAKLKTKKKAN